MKSNARERNHKPYTTCTQAVHRHFLICDISRFRLILQIVHRNCEFGHVPRQFPILAMTPVKGEIETVGSVHRVDDRRGLFDARWFRPPWST